jgi:hypothetical protein
MLGFPAKGCAMPAEKRTGAFVTLMGFLLVRLGCGAPSRASSLTFPRPSSHNPFPHFPDSAADELPECCVCFHSLVVMLLNKKKGLTFTSFPAEGCIGNASYIIAGNKFISAFL